MILLFIFNSNILIRLYFYACVYSEFKVYMCNLTLRCDLFYLIMNVFFFATSCYLASTYNESLSLQFIIYRASYRQPLRRIKKFVAILSDLSKLLTVRYLLPPCAIYHMSVRHLFALFIYMAKKSDLFPPF